MQVSRSVVTTYGAGLPKVLQTYALSIGTTGQQIVPVSPTLGSYAASQTFRSGLVFHNPGTIDVYIAQAVDLNNNPIVAVVGGAGTLLIIAGATLIIDAPGPYAWNAVAASAAVLTVLEYLA